MLVPIIMGSEKDREHADKVIRVLDDFGVSYEVNIASAHKTPEKTLAIVDGYNNRADEAICYVTIAGRSNALSAVVAARAVHPVIACPPFADKADYLVNIHSSLQAPSRVPVMTVVDPGNAALSAVRILGLKDEHLRSRILQDIQDLRS